MEGGSVGEYEIQGRRMDRGVGGRVVRHHVRLASADDMSAALEIADAMAADDFMAWVFEVHPGQGRKSYRLVEVRAAT